MKLAKAGLLLICSAATVGCAFSPPADRRPGPPAPRTLGPVEHAGRTLTLNYALPGRAAAPALICWERIEILDDVGRACPVRAVNMGKGQDGYWTSISFTFAPEASTIFARLVLRIDADDYPLTATLTRLEQGRWRADYGIVRPR